MFRFFTKKDLWQNFLVNEQILEIIVDTADISKDDVVVEIWPGPWVLTQNLIKTWAEIMALEIDKKVITVLEYTTWRPKNLEIQNISALDFKSENPWFILCANIPYYLTSPILRHYLSSKNKPIRCVLLMQKEVAQKICAKPSNLSVISLEVLIYWKPEIIKIVPRESFFPSPKVESAVLKIDVFSKPKIEKEDIMLFWEIVHHCFTEKRKKIINSFSKYRDMWPKNAEFILEESGIDPNRRPQTISIEEWKNIITIFKDNF